MNNLFKNRAFLVITFSDLFQNLAIWIRNMAILYFIMDQTQGDPIAVSLITVLEYVPIFVFSFIGGALADRWNPKRTMIIGDILSSLSIVLIIAVMASGYWQVLYAATFVSSIVSQFSQPSSVKIVKRNVEEEHVQSAIAITQSSQSLFLILGPILGTFIYSTLGIQASMYSLLVLFIASALILTLLPKDEPSPASHTSLLSEMKEGWRYVLESSSLKFLTLLFIILGLSSGLISPLEIFLITERLGLEQTSVQYLTGASGLGLLIGGGVAAALSGKLDQNRTLVLGVICLAATTLGEVLSGWLWLTLIISFLSSVCLAFVNVIISTFLVTKIDEQMIGRVNGTITPMFMGAMLIGSSLAGIVMSNTSLLTAYILSVLVLTVGLIPGIKIKFDSKKDTVETSVPLDQELSRGLD